MEIKKNNYWLLSKLCYVAIVFELIAAIHGSGLAEYGMDMESSNPIVKLSGILAYFIPEWLTVIFCGFLWVFLLLALRKHYMTMNAKKTIPFITLICLGIVMYSFFLILALADKYNSIIIVRNDFLILIPFSIIEFIVGLKLKGGVKIKLKDEQETSWFAWIGLMMMIQAIVILIIVGIRRITFYNDDLWWIPFLKAGAIGMYYGVLMAFFKQKNEKVKSIENEIV